MLEPGMPLRRTPEPAGGTGMTRPRGFTRRTVLRAGAGAALSAVAAPALGPLGGAIKPDNVPPRLKAGDIKGGYDIYGPRVPAVVVSPYARPHAVTDVVHDHTSILATIEAKWNLPACTYRDANATTLVDFLDLKRAAFADPPKLAPPHDLAASEQNCSDADPKLTIRRHPGADGNRRHPRRRTRARRPGVARRSRR